MNPITQTMIQGKIRQIGNYILESPLGSGQFGKVYKAKEKNTGVYYAVKKIEKKRINSNALLPKLLNTEIKIMKEITHPNILHLYEYLESKTNYYLVLNYCNQGDMENYMKNRSIKYFEEGEAIGLLQQIMNGFHELRRYHVMHRDFKLPNIFMCNDVVVIGDFGLAKYGEVGATVLGTPTTMAPELLIPSENDNVEYTSKADIWSVGVVYYQMLFGEQPYNGNTIPELSRNIKLKTGDKLEFLRPVSEESRDILRRMMTLDPEKRINWADLFNHPLFRKETMIKPQIKENIAKIMQTFVGSNMNAKVLDPATQFHQNRQQGDIVNFTPVDDSKNIKQNNEMVRPTPINEDTIDPKLEQEIMMEMAMKEVIFTYNHERNKILFLVFSVKHIQWALTDQNFWIYAEPFFKISMLILKKAKVLNDSIAGSLQTCANIFNINQQFWISFVESPNLANTRGIFIGLSSLLQEYLNLIRKRLGDNGISIANYEGFLNPQNIKLGELDKVLESEKSRIQSIVQNDEKYKYDPAHSSKVTCIDKLIYNCIWSEQNLKYFIKNKDGIYDKFKMELFYKTLTQNQGTPFY